MQGKMNEDSETVDPPINANIGPKFGTDCATNKTAAKIVHRITTRFKLNSIEKMLQLY